jgi:hypothetical protein
MATAEHAATSATQKQQQQQRKVSLLSQQIACAKSKAAAAAAAAATAAAAVESDSCEAGESGRNRREFWRYLQVSQLLCYSCRHSCCHDHPIKDIHSLVYLG